MIIDDTEPIHGFFGLSYSSHLVLEPERIARQDPPWQQDLNTALEELNAAFPDHVYRPGRVLAIEAEEVECAELNEEQLETIGMSTSDGLDDHSECDHEDDEDENWWCWRERVRWYDWRGDEHGRHDRVMVPTESVDHALRAKRIVLSRTLLQSMPVEWQKRFVLLLEQYDRGSRRPERYDICYYAPDGTRTTDPVPHYNRGRTYIEPAAQR